jgi:hypothetical protein
MLTFTIVNGRRAAVEDVLYPERESPSRPKRRGGGESHAPRSFHADVSSEEIPLQELLPEQLFSASGAGCQSLRRESSAGPKELRRRQAGVAGVVGLAVAAGDVVVTNVIPTRDAASVEMPHEAVGRISALRVVIDIRVVGRLGPGNSSVYASMPIAPGVVVAWTMSCARPLKRLRIGCLSDS